MTERSFYRFSNLFYERKLQERDNITPYSLFSRVHQKSKSVLPLLEN